MRVSVVVATYNGEKYIYEQLESLLLQNRMIDEVFIFDDISTDSTAHIVKQFIKDNDLQDRWKLVINEERKGCVKNFLDGATMASGTIVFYCDQDDIWHKEKVEHMLEGFEKNPDMQACYCLSNWFDSEGNEIHRLKRFSNVPIRKKGFQKVTLNEAVRFNKSPGLCLAIKKELILEAKELILTNHLTHDLPIGTIAAIHDGYYMLNEVLVNHRIHTNNLSAPAYKVRDRIARLDVQIQGRRLKYDQMTAIYSVYAKCMTKKECEDLKNAIQMTEDIILDLENGNAFGLFKKLFEFNPMMNWWLTLNNFISCFFMRMRKN